MYYLTWHTRKIYLLLMVCLYSHHHDSDDSGDSVVVLDGPPTKKQRITEAPTRITSVIDTIKDLVKDMKD